MDSVKEDYWTKERMKRWVRVVNRIPIDGAQFKFDENLLDAIIDNGEVAVDNDSPVLRKFEYKCVMTPKQIDPAHKVETTKMRIRTVIELFEEK